MKSTGRSSYAEVLHGRQNPARKLAKAGQVLRCVPFHSRFCVYPLADSVLKGGHERNRCSWTFVLHILGRCHDIHGCHLDRPISHSADIVPS